MARDLNHLANRLDRLARQVPLRANEVAKAVARAVIKDLLPATPVDITRALSNWIPSHDAPANYSILPYVPGHLGSTRGASISAALAEAMSAISDKRPGRPIFFTNNVDYIGLLNAGSSKQAPAGFVERSVLVGRLTLRSTGLGLT